MGPLASGLTLTACLTLCGCAAVLTALGVPAPMASALASVGQTLPGASAADLADVEARVRNLRDVAAPLVCPAPALTSPVAAPLTATEIVKALYDAEAAAKLTAGAVKFAAANADAGAGEGGT